jgi:hypothetical protein
MAPELQPRTIQTPWGSLAPVVDLAPLVYVLVLYGLVYFLPFGVFEYWTTNEDGPSEWLQFAAYAGACVCSLRVLWQRRRRWRSLQWLAWLLLALFLFYVAAEEISWGERVHGWGVEALRQINAQKETNLHNLPAVQNYLHVSFIAAGLFFGFAGWRWMPRIDAWPARRYSLYFLIVALFYTYFDLSWITHAERIRNDQEGLELLMAVGLFLHARQWAFNPPSPAAATDREPAGSLD